MKVLKISMILFEFKPKLSPIKRLWYWIINKKVGTFYMEHNDEMICLGDVYYRELRGAIAVAPIFIGPSDSWGLSFDNKMEAETEAKATPIGEVYEVEDRI